MKNNKTQESCPICAEGHLTANTDHKYAFTFEGVEHTVHNLEQSVCDVCEVSLFVPPQMTANNQKVLAYQATVEGYISPSRILMVREKYWLPIAIANVMFANNGLFDEKPLYAAWEIGLAAPSREQAKAMLEALDNPGFVIKLAQDLNIALPEPASA